MKKKALNLGLVIIIFILLTNTVSKANSLQYVGVEIGDKFKYKITYGHILTKFNETIYLDDTDLNIQGKKVDIRITAIDEYLLESFLGLFVEEIMINVTETVDGVEYEGYTLLDEWHMMFQVILNSYLYNTVAFDPENYEFHPPDTSATDDEEFLLLPIFATTNTSFYQEMLDHGGISTAPLQPQEGLPSIMVLEGIQITFDGESKFTLNATMEDTVSGTIDVDVEWSSYAILEFYVFIDTQRGIIKEFYLNFKNDIIIGANTTINEINYGYKEEISGSGNTFTLDNSTMLPIYISVSLIVIFVIVKRKRNS
jgi:hypothetical protein